MAPGDQRGGVVLVPVAIEGADLIRHPHQLESPWVAVAILVAGIALTFAVWAWTGPLIALLAFAGLCTVGASVATALQRRNRLG